MDLRDIILLPRALYKKLTAKRASLFIGIILVGLIDMGFSIFIGYNNLFAGKSSMVIYFNITLALVLVILTGFIDVVFFSVPLFDLFKHFKMEKGIGDYSQQLVKLMKVYICANFLVLPLNILFYIIFRSYEFGSSFATVVLAYFVIFLPSIWASAAIARGVNEIYSFIQPLKKVVFLIVFLWSMILGLILNYIIEQWFMLLFR